MNSQEAINALFEGKCVRHHTWEEGLYIFMPLGGVATYSDGRYVKTELFYHNDWEIYKVRPEMYQWLCYDVKKEEYYLSGYICGEMKYALGETRYKVIKRIVETKRVPK